MCVCVCTPSVGGLCQVIIVSLCLGRRVVICALVVTFDVFCKGVPSLDPDLHDNLKICGLLFFYQYANACVAFNVISTFDRSDHLVVLN